MKHWFIGIGFSICIAMVTLWLTGPLKSAVLGPKSADATSPYDSESSRTSQKLSDRRSALAVRNASPFPPHLSVSPLHQAFSQSKDYFSLFNSLAGRTDAEALFYRASILDRCRKWAGNPKAETADQRLRRWNEELTGPYKDIRKSLNAKLVMESAISRCSNFVDAISDVDVENAYDAAAKAGDIRAQINQVHRRLLSSADTTPVSTAGLPFTSEAKISFVFPSGPTEQEVDLLKKALASKDPVQIESAGPLLTARYKEYELKFGDGKGLAGVPDYFLWRSVACHYAGGCGPESYFVQQGCALDGRCDVSTYDEQLQRYIFKEADWQNFLSYRSTLINAIDSQNWSLLQERRGPRSNTFGTQIMTSNLTPRFNLRYY